MAEKFSTEILDRVIAQERIKREQNRHKMLAAVFLALEKLSREISFEEAYIFGSLASPYLYFENSDIDIAFLGLKDEDFFQAMAFLSRELEAEVDILQLEDCPWREKIMREGIKWKKKN